MSSPSPHLRSRHDRRRALALAAVLLACAAVALTASHDRDRSGPHGAATSPPTPASGAAPQKPTTPPRPRARRPPTQSSTPDRRALRPSGSDAPVRVTAAQQRRTRAAARVATSFARAWTRYTADPADRQAARRVRATTSAGLWTQLRQVRAPAGRYQGADRYEAIAGVSVPLAGRRLEVTVSLRDRAGQRQYLTVLATPQGNQWKIAQIVL